MSAIKFPNQLSVQCSKVLLKHGEMWQSATPLGCEIFPTLALCLVALFGESGEPFKKWVSLVDHRCRLSEGVPDPGSWLSVLPGFATHFCSPCATMN